MWPYPEPCQTAINVLSRAAAMDPIGHDDEKIHITVRSHPPLSGRAKKEDTGWLDGPYYSLHDIVEYLLTNTCLGMHQLPPYGGVLPPASAETGHRLQDNRLASSVARKRRQNVFGQAMQSLLAMLKG
jgi:hypothetical protein